MATMKNADGEWIVYQPNGEAAAATAEALRAVSLALLGAPEAVQGDGRYHSPYEALTGEEGRRIWDELYGPSGARDADTGRPKR